MLEEMERQKKEQEAEEQRKKVKYWSRETDFVCVNWWGKDDVVTLKIFFLKPCLEADDDNIFPLLLVSLAAFSDETGNRKREGLNNRFFVGIFGAVIINFATTLNFFPTLFSYPLSAGLIKEGKL